MKIILVMAMTADGKIAKNSRHFPDWTSREDKKHFAGISKEHKVVIFGKNTFLTFPAPLKDRLNVVFSSKKIDSSHNNVRWVTGEPEDALAELDKEGYHSAVLGGGAFLNTLFLKKKLIDEIVLTIEPKIFGDGISVFSGDFDLDLTLLDVKKLNGNSLALTYKVNYQ